MLQKKITPNLPSRVFKTSYNYDSWNRLQYMIYPDQEKVNYSYDLGGNLTRMTGQVYNEPYNYIDRIDYDYYEQRAYLKYGNKIVTFYNYTPALRRLENLKVKTSDAQDLYNNLYKYDKVGNVTSLINQAGATANTMGGNYGHGFVYDNLNRLASASGYFNGNQAQQQNNNDFQSDYTMNMQYNATHGILNKTQLHYKNMEATPVAANTYSNTYNYLENTHKLVHIDDSTTGATEDFNYDLNGNLVSKTNTDGSVRSLFWDESNRLRVVKDPAGMQHYIYDASGERILKANSNTEAVYGNGTLLDPASTTVNSYATYPSANLVIDANGIYSKHYYAGTQRIVSRIGEQSSSIFGDNRPKISNNKDGNKLQELQKTNLQQILAKGKLGQASFKSYQPYTYDEAQKALAEEDKENLKETLAPPSGAGGLYFYHPDHLGTSTFLTDYNGNAYQFFLNLPFGETMAEQLGSNYYNTPYKFNGKELDEETGLYYYGARYYDPRVSIWLSVDPLAESYPDWNPYNYCIQNPINVIDPTGMSPEGPGDPPPTELNEVVIVNSYKKPMSSVKSAINDFSKSGLVFIMNMAATHANNNLSFGIASLPSKPEDFGEYELSARLGRLAGDVAAILQGLSEDSVAGSAEVVTIGVATIPAAGLAIHGTAVAVAGTVGAGSEVTGLFNFAKDKHSSSSKGTSFRGGNKKSRDGYITSMPKDFQRWFHRYLKSKGAPNASKKEIDEAFSEWTASGKPNVK